MNGRNAIGRRISLLNDEEDAPLTGRLPLLSTSSRSSSYRSTPALSPHAPQLIRSDSTDSGALQTPSPMTPHFSFEGLAAPRRVDSPSYSVASSCSYGPKDAPSMYASVQQQSASHANLDQSYSASSQQMSIFQQPPATSASERRLSSSSSTKQPSGKKNQYPCPMAKQLGCTDYFTTSGHAARHAKKHTGKKDAFCPECNKAFTRKDNMEQHRRTHQSGRGASKSGAGASAKKSRQNQQQQQQHHQQQKKKNSKAPPHQSPLIPIDPSLSSVSPVSQTLSLAGSERPHLQSFPRLTPDTYSSPSVAKFGMPRYDDMSPGLAHGLETLAIVASGQTLQL